MSRAILIAGVALLGAAASSASGADAPSQENIERCERYATEDEVSPHDRGEYMEECLAELAEEAEDSAVATSASATDAASQGGNVARCGRYAVEDEVSLQGWDEYMEECLAELAEDEIAEDAPNSDTAIGPPDDRGAPSQEDRELCERYAVEDAVAPYDWDDYVERCLADLAGGTVPAYGPDSDAPALRIDASE